MVDKFDMMMDWIAEHTDSAMEYAKALHQCGFDKREIIDELIGFSIDVDEETEIAEWLKEIGR